MRRRRERRAAIDAEAAAISAWLTQMSEMTDEPVDMAGRFDRPRWHPSMGEYRAPEERWLRAL